MSLHGVVAAAVVVIVVDVVSVVVVVGVVVLVLPSCGVVVVVVCRCWVTWQAVDLARKTFPESRTVTWRDLVWTRIRYAIRGGWRLRATGDHDRHRASVRHAHGAGDWWR